MGSMRCLCPLLLLGVLGLLSSASGATVTVGFVQVQHLSYGQVFKLVGNISELGGWDISKGVNMTWHTGDIWTASVELETGESLKYKTVVVDYSTGECYCWMPDPNRSLTVPSDATSVYFVSVFWDVNTCASTCSNTAACSFSNVGTCSTTSTALHGDQPAIFSVV